MPPILARTYLADLPFNNTKICYKRLMECELALSRLRYERDKLTTRLWQHYEEFEFQDKEHVDQGVEKSDIN